MTMKHMNEHPYLDESPGTHSAQTSKWGTGEGYSMAILQSLSLQRSIPRQEHVFWSSTAMDGTTNSTQKVLNEELISKVPGNCNEWWCSSVILMAFLSATKSEMMVWVHKCTYAERERDVCTVVYSMCMRWKFIGSMCKNRNTFSVVCTKWRFLAVRWLISHWSQASYTITGSFPSIGGSQLVVNHGLCHTWLTNPCMQLRIHAMLPMTQTLEAASQTPRRGPGALSRWCS